MRILFSSSDVHSLLAALIVGRRCGGHDIMLGSAGRGALLPVLLNPDALALLAVEVPDIYAGFLRDSFAVAGIRGELFGSAFEVMSAEFRCLERKTAEATLNEALAQAGARRATAAEADLVVGPPAAAGESSSWLFSGDGPEDVGAFFLGVPGRDTLEFTARDDGHGTLWAIRFPSKDGEGSIAAILCPREEIRSANLEAAPSDTVRAYARPLLGEAGKMLPVGRDEQDISARHCLIGPGLADIYGFGDELLLALRQAVGLAEAISTEGLKPPADFGTRQARKSFDQAMTSRIRWFARTRHLRRHSAPRLALNLLTVGVGRPYGRLKRDDPRFVASVEAEGFTAQPRCAPMSSPYRLRDLTLKNRIVISPMAQYSAENGVPTDWHLVHLGSRAVGGAGLIIAEMSCVSAEARITLGCPGLYTDEQMVAWRRIVAFIHGSSEAKIGIQLGHSGRKGSTQPLWMGRSRPLDAGNWPLFSASPIGWAPENQVPAELSRNDMDLLERQFQEATLRADQADFDLIELHFAHGYLAASFLSPLTNKRSDEYGGPIENRIRLPLRLFRAVRSAWPAHKPLCVRFSATDWLPGGTTLEDAIQFAHALKAEGCDMVVASAGQTTPESRPEYGPLFQTFIAERIRLEAGIPTMAVGGITNDDDANSIIAGGRADLCAIARVSLLDPYWPKHMEGLGGESRWPNQYASLERFVPNPRGVRG